MSCRRLGSRPRHSVIGVVTGAPIQGHGSFPAVSERAR